MLSMDTKCILLTYQPVAVQLWFCETVVYNIT